MKPPRLARRRRECGQSSVFLLLIASTLVLFAMLAVNDGMIVRDKLGLQNTADLVAFSAATVQAQGLNEVTRVNRVIRDEYFDEFLPVVRSRVFESEEAGRAFIDDWAERWAGLRKRQNALRKEIYGVRSVQAIQEAVTRNAPDVKVDLVSFHRYIREERLLIPKVTLLEGENHSHHDGFFRDGTFRYFDCEPGVVGACPIREADYEIQVWRRRDRWRTSFAWVRLTREEPPPYVLDRLFGLEPPPPFVAETMAAPYGGSVGDREGNRQLFRASYKAKLVPIAAERMKFHGLVPHEIVRVYPLPEYERLLGLMPENVRRSDYGH